jgi:hypothetical protein
MPARKRPTLEDTVTARRVLLDGLARDADIFELVSELAPLHPRDNTFPGEVFLRLAADALDWCEASRADPLSLEGLRERFLPECTFRGRQNKKLQYAVLAAAALHGGTDPDLLDEVAWWQTDDFWQYALYATVAYIRAAASRAGGPGRWRAGPSGMWHGPSGVWDGPAPTFSRWTEYFHVASTNPAGPGVIIVTGAFSDGGVEHPGRTIDQAVFNGGSFRIDHSAARTARSAQSGLGRAIWRRSTATS